MAGMERPVMRVTFGEELFSVTYHGQYCQFRVGPYSYETQPLIGETEATCWARAWKAVNDQATAVFLAKRNGFFDRLEGLNK